MGGGSATRASTSPERLDQPRPLTLDELLAALRRLTDAERFAFAYLAVDQPDPTEGTPWNYRYGRIDLEARFQALPFWNPRRPTPAAVRRGAHQAVVVLHDFHDDGTADERDYYDTFRDGYPSRPYPQWEAAIRVTWMLAVAILAKDALVHDLQALVREWRQAGGLPSGGRTRVGEET